MKHAMHDWRGADGKPDVHKMLEFIEQQDRAHLLDIVGWAVFLIWIGFAWLLELSLGWGIVGTGVLLLLLQGLRAVFHVHVEAFWVIAAIAFVVGGFWELRDDASLLAPLVLIGVGIGLIIWYCTKTLSQRKRMF